VFGRLLANSDGDWATATPLQASNTAVIELSGDAKIDASYLDIKLYGTEPTNKYVEVYKTAYTCADQTTGVNTTTGVITFGTAPPSAGTAVKIRSSATLPTGFHNDDIYYVRSVSGNTCKLALQNADAQIVIPTATGSGTLTMYDGHTNTSTKVMNVVQDVTTDTPWTTTANFNRVVLCDIGPETYDQQRDTLAAIAVNTLTITTNNVDSVQYPLARIYLCSRNVQILSNSTTTAQIIVDYTTKTHSGVFQCALINTAGTGTTFYGYGISAGVGHTISGIISGCNMGLYLCTSPTITGIIASCSTGSRQCVSTIVSGTVIGCSSGIYNTGNAVGGEISGTICGCSYGSYYGQGMVISGLIHGCSDGISSYNQILTGSVRSCSNGCNVLTALSMSGSVIGCTRGIANTTSTYVTGTIRHCTYGINVTSADVRKATFTNNLYDIGIPRGIRIYGSQLTSSTQVLYYLHSYDSGTDQNYGVSAYDYAGNAGCLARWDVGGYTISAVYASGTHGTPPITPPTCVHETIAQDNDAEHHVILPLYGEKGQVLTVTCYAKQPTASVFDTLPVFELIDPSLAPGSDVLATSTQVDNTDWQTHTLATTALGEDKPVWMRMRCKGGNSGGMGTDTLYWFQVIDYGGGTGGETYMPGMLF
jgi:hypothetical protein